MAGTVLTSSLFRASGRNSKEPGPGLSKFDFSTIQIPLLFVHHVSDQCQFTPYGDAARLSDKYPLISVFGGDPPTSGPCDAFSQHGYLGKESATIEQDRQLDVEEAVPARSEIGVASNRATKTVDRVEI
jgi:hypothetical protein